MPDAWGEITELLLTGFEYDRIRGHGQAAFDDRAVFTAIAYVLTIGFAWRHLPRPSGVCVPAAHPLEPGVVIRADRDEAEDFSVSEPVNAVAFGGSNLHTYVLRL